MRYRQQMRWMALVLTLVATGLLDARFLMFSVNAQAAEGARLTLADHGSAQAARVRGDRPQATKSRPRTSRKAQANAGPTRPKGGETKTAELLRYPVQEGKTNYLPLLQDLARTPIFQQIEP